LVFDAPSAGCCGNGNGSNQAEAIHQRRSVRGFVDKPVPDKVLWEILEAGTWAPLASNMQAWEFVIVKGLEARRKVVNTTDAGTIARAGVHTQEWIIVWPLNWNLPTI